MAKVGYRDIPTPNLKCRSLGHAWEPVVTLVETHGRVEVMVVQLVCARCDTGRSDLIRRKTGERHKPVKYEYTKGYLIKDRARWGSRAQFNAGARRELYERTLVRTTGGEATKKEAR